MILKSTQMGSRSSWNMPGLVAGMAAYSDVRSHLQVSRVAVKIIVRIVMMLIILKMIVATRFELRAGSQQPGVQWRRALGFLAGLPESSLQHRAQSLTWEDLEAVGPKLAR